MVVKCLIKQTPDVLFAQRTRAYVETYLIAILYVVITRSGRREREIKKFVLFSDYVLYASTSMDIRMRKVGTELFYCEQTLSN